MKKGVAMMIAVGLVLSACGIKKTEKSESEVAAAFDSKEEYLDATKSKTNPCETKVEGCFEYSMPIIESAVKASNSETKTKEITDLNEVNEVLLQIEKQNIAIWEEYQTKKKEYSSEPGKLADYLMNININESDFIILKNLNTLSLLKTNETISPYIENVTNLTKHIYKDMSLTYYRTSTNVDNEKFNVEIESNSSSVDEYKSEIINFLSFNFEDDFFKNRLDVYSFGISGKPIENEVDTLAVWVIKDSMNDNQYNLHIISDSSKSYIEELGWAGASAGDKITEGTFSIGLQDMQNAKRFFLQEASIGNWRFNLSRETNIVLNGTPDIFVVSQSESSNISSAKLFYVKKGKVIEIKTPEGGDFYFSRIKNLENGQFLIINYNNAEGLWDFTTYQLDIASGKTSLINNEQFEFNEGQEKVEEIFE